jgi:hypothetical protein
MNGHDLPDIHHFMFFVQRKQNKNNGIVALTSSSGSNEGASQAVSRTHPVSYSVNNGCSCLGGEAAGA